MILFLEISIIVFLIIVQSIFGVGLLLFGTPSFLLLGYDFPNTINILMPISILVSLLQFTKSKIKDKKFIREYNYYCLPFLVLFLFLALSQVCSGGFHQELAPGHHHKGGKFHRKPLKGNKKYIG